MRCVRWNRTSREVIEILVQSEVASNIFFSLEEQHVHQLIRIALVSTDWSEILRNSRKDSLRPAGGGGGFARSGPVSGFRDEPRAILLVHGQTVADRISRRDPLRDVPWQPQAIRPRGHERDMVI